MVNLMTLLTENELKSCKRNGLDAYVYDDCAQFPSYVANGKEYKAVTDILNQSLRFTKTPTRPKKINLITLEALADARNAPENAVINMMTDAGIPVYERKGRLYAAPSTITKITPNDDYIFCDDE